jgi:hypothetical protein
MEPMCASTVWEVMAAERRCRPPLLPAPRLGVLSCAAPTRAQAPTSRSEALAATEFLAASNPPSIRVMIATPPLPSLSGVPGVSCTCHTYHSTSFRSPPLRPTASVSSVSPPAPPEESLGTSKVAWQDTPTNPASRYSTITNPVRPGGRTSRDPPAREARGVGEGRKDGPRWFRGEGTSWMRMQRGSRRRATEAWCDEPVEWVE